MENTGNVILAAVNVNDSVEGAITCPKTTLTPGDSMTCTQTGTAITGQYANVARATGVPPSLNLVFDDDPSHYFGLTTGIGIVKEVKDADGVWQDANSPTGPFLVVDSTVEWRYTVTNKGNTASS